VNFPFGAKYIYVLLIPVNNFVQSHILSVMRFFNIRFFRQTAPFGPKKTCQETISNIFSNIKKLFNFSGASLGSAIPVKQKSFVVVGLFF
jgi:hypothetical protein